MNICFFSIVNYWQGITGGMEVHGKLLSEGLIKKGHSLSIISSNHPDGKHYEEINNIHIYYLTNTKFGSYWHNWGKESFRKFQQLHKRNPFDIVFSQSFNGYYFAKSREKAGSVPMVSFLHGAGPLMAFNQIKTLLLHQKMLTPSAMKILGSFIFHYFFLHIPTIKFSDIIICVSDHVKESVLKWYPFKNKRIYSVLNGLDIDSTLPVRSCRKNIRQKYRIKDGDVLLMTSGTVNREKGHHIAVEILSKLADQNKNLKLLIVGGGEYCDRLIKLINKYQLGDRIIITGYVAHEIIKSYYQAADIYLMPTLRDEGLPFALIEAMSTGLPIIASRIGGIPSVLQDGINALLIQPNNINEIVSKLKWLLNDRSLSNRLGSRARQMAVQELNSDKMVEKTMAIINSDLLHKQCEY